MVSYLWFLYDIQFVKDFPITSKSLFPIHFHMYKFSPVVSSDDVFQTKFCVHSLFQCMLIFHVSNL